MEGRIDYDVKGIGERVWECQHYCHKNLEAKPMIQNRMSSKYANAVVHLTKKIENKEGDP